MTKIVEWPTEEGESVFFSVSSLNRPGLGGRVRLPGQGCRARARPPAPDRRLFPCLSTWLQVACRCRGVSRSRCAVCACCVGSFAGRLPNRMSPLGSYSRIKCVSDQASIFDFTGDDATVAFWSMVVVAMVRPGHRGQRRYVSA